jgi:F0F1-type ATP synthase assembly protein I
MGMELGGAVAGFCLLGYWIDWRFGTGPRWLVICAILGLVGGMYNFIRQALKESAESNRRQREERESRDQ